MFLQRVRVYPDWQKRERLAQARDQAQWNLTLSAVLISVLLVGAVRQLPLAADQRALLPEGIAASLYFTIGIAVLANKSSKLLLASVFLLLVAGVLASDVLTRAASRSQDPLLTTALLAGVALVALAPGLGLTGCVLLRIRPGIDRSRVPAWGGIRIVSGLLIGCLVVLLVYVAQRFAALSVTYSFPPLAPFFQHTLYLIGVGSIGEELVFRGIVFRYLYHRRRLEFWTATVLTLVLNVPLYLVILPPFDSAPQGALMLMGYCLMAIASCALYSWERSLVAPIANNLVFQCAAFLMR